jgi:hypothetical protein
LIKFHRGDKRCTGSGIGEESEPKRDGQIQPEL